MFNTLWVLSSKIFKAHGDCWGSRTDKSQRQHDYPLEHMRPSSSNRVEERVAVEPGAECRRGWGSLGTWCSIKSSSFSKSDMTP